MAVMIQPVAEFTEPWTDTAFLAPGSFASACTANASGAVRLAYLRYGTHPQAGRYYGSQG